MVEVYATGSKKGAGFFAEVGDVDSAAAILTLDDGTMALVSNSRYNSRGDDVRLELHGSADSIAVGPEDGLPLRSVQPGLAVHHRGRSGDRLGGRGLHDFPSTAPSGADRRGALMTIANKTPSRAGVSQIAAAPISWGVCEVPGWGYQLSPRRVLAEMRQIGMAATELGPAGFLPEEPAAMAAVLAEHQLQAVGGFVPALMHVPGHDPVPGLDRTLDGFEAARAGVLVLSADSGQDGYDTRPELDADGWKLLLGNLDRLAALAAGRGIRAVLHPHVGTMIENGDDVQRVLEGSSISLCLDTGHLLIGGTDPAELTRQVPERIAHTHLKDVDATLAKRVRDGRLSYTDGVRQGMYRPLGTGDVDIAAIVEHLARHDYTGWYTLEQDTILTDEPDGEGPLTDVRTSTTYVRDLLAVHTGTA